MRSDDIHVYEVRDGTTVLGRFLKKTPAEKRKKELKKAGRKVRLVSLFTRKFVPIEPKELPKGMEYWKGSIPCEIPTEAANQLSKGWQHINDTFYIGSYRHGELCLPNDRDADLSIQPNGDELALCYISFEDKKAYLILGRIDYISVTENTISISGRVENNSFVTLRFDIRDLNKQREPEKVTIEKGWYVMDSGYLLYVGENDPSVLEEQRSNSIVAMVRYVIVYPGMLGDDFVSSNGFLPVRRGQTLEQAILWKFRSRPKRCIDIDDPKKVANAFVKKKVGKMNEMIAAYPGCEEMGAILKKKGRR